MKFQFLVLFLGITTLVKATTITLNNNNPSAGQYTTFAAAQAAASNGDTILVQGSTNNYGDLTISKRLVIIGPGHNPTDKQNTQKAFCDNFFFQTGSNNTKIYGMEVYSIYGDASNTGIELHLLKITYRIFMRSGNNDNWIVDGCVFTHTGENINAQGYATVNMICRNNIFNGYIESMGTSGYRYFLNNIFLGNTSWAFRSSRYIYANNNIFYRQGMQDNGNANSIVYTKNVSYQSSGGNTFPNGSGNFEGVDPQFVTSIGTGAFFDYATDYHVQNAALLGTGSDGTDVGIYGGTGDYSQNGIPRNPYIKTFTITGSNTVNAGDPVQIYIKAKVRN